MAYCCSQCSFSAHFESALTMHHQLYHETKQTEDGSALALNNAVKEKSKSMPRDSSPTSIRSQKLYRDFKLPTRSSSATRLFGRLRARICRSKTLFSHPEETADQIDVNAISSRSECTSKAMKMDCLSRTSGLLPLIDHRETYACHLCSFDADRITALDRHLLNDHKIGLENLLKLVLAKTKDGLSEDTPPEFYGIRQPYYKTQNEIIDDGEFIIETVTPKIKILKHASTNTDLQWRDIPNLNDNCRLITKELNELIKYPSKVEKNELLNKIQTLNDCMCRFVDSSNALKKVLSRECEGRSRKEQNDTAFDFSLDLDSPRDWEKAHSEKLERNRHSEKFRGEKSKLSAESYYF